MQTLTYGAKKPEDGDKGQTVFDALEENIDLFDAHTHDGTDSAAVASTSLTKPTQNIASGSWTTVSNGYKQTITCPGVVTLASCVLQFRVRTGTHVNKIIHPTIVPITVTQYEVIVNEPGLDLQVMYI